MQPLLHAVHIMAERCAQYECDGLQVTAVLYHDIDNLFWLRSHVHSSQACCAMVYYSQVVVVQCHCYLINHTFLLILTID